MLSDANPLVWLLCDAQEPAQDAEGGDADGRGSADDVGLAPPHTPLTGVRRLTPSVLNAHRVCCMDV